MQVNQVNFTGNEPEVAKSSVGKKVAIGAAVAAGVAAVGLAAHKGDVFKKISAASKEGDKFSIGKFFKAINKENIGKAFKGVGEGFSKLWKSITGFFGKKAADKTENLTNNAAEIVEEVANTAESVQ